MVDEDGCVKNCYRCGRCSRDNYLIIIGPINPCCCKGCSCKNWSSCFNRGKDCNRKKCRTCFDLDIREFPIAVFFMGLYTIWCHIVLTSGIHETTPDVSQTFNIVGGTIAFILPLIAASAVSRNKEILNNYKAFCGDVLALGWEVLAYVREENINDKDEEVDERVQKLFKNDRDQDDERIQQLFEMCLVLPTMIKWKYRKGLDIGKVWMIKNYEKTDDANKKKTKVKEGGKSRRASMLGNIRSIQNINVNAGDGVLYNELNTETIELINEKFGRKFTDTSTGKEFMVLYRAAAKKYDSKTKKVVVPGVEACDLMFAYMNKLISEFNTKGDTRKNMLTRTVERVYGSYGDMGNRESYKLPQVYNVFLYIALSIFVFLFPLNYKNSGGELEAMNVTSEGDFEALYAEEFSGVVKHQYNIIWHGIIVLYFLFGFHYMTTKVGSVFKSQSTSPGYSTVGEDETEVNNSLIGLYKTRKPFQTKRKLQFVTTEATTEVKVNDLHHRRKLYA